MPSLGPGDPEYSKIKIARVSYNEKQSLLQDFILLVEEIRQATAQADNFERPTVVLFVRVLVTYQYPLNV